ncbi:hypothetical protein PanWU01x14_081640, partial [Parasponia andersonii]
DSMFGLLIRTLKIDGKRRLGTQISFGTRWRWDVGGPTSGMPLSDFEVRRGRWKGR